MKWFFRGKIFPISRFVVREESMVPVFMPGDHVLTFNWARVSKGDVIVFKSDGKKYIKRITKIKSNLIAVSGDNNARSAKMGTIEKNQIVGKVIFKY